MCAARANLAFGFTLKNIENGGFRLSEAHETNSLLDRSKHVYTKDNLEKPKDILNKRDVIESCSREGINTKWRFYKLTNLTVFASSLKDVPMRINYAVLPKPLMRNRTINCLKSEQKTRQVYNDILCTFCALALHLHGNQRQEKKTSKTFHSSKNRMEKFSSNQFKEDHNNKIPVVEDPLTLKILP